MNSEDTFAYVFVLCFLSVMFMIGYIEYKSHELKKHAIDNGYEQVLIPGKTVPIWKKVDGNKCLEKTNGT